MKAQGAGTIPVTGKEKRTHRRNQRKGNTVTNICSQRVYCKSEICVGFLKNQDGAPNPEHAEV